MQRGVNQQSTARIAGAFVISFIVFAGVYFIYSGYEGLEDTTTPAVVKTPATPFLPQGQGTGSQTEFATYRDGTYSASKTYKVPEGHTETVSVDVLLDADIVTALKVEATPTNDDSAKYQVPFQKRIVGEVEGKDLDRADISRVGGASITSGMFNDLLEAIRAEAQI